MAEFEASSPQCVSCGIHCPPDQVISVGAVPPEIADLSAFDRGAQICDDCLARRRLALLTSQLVKERGQLTQLEAEVATRTASGGTIARQLGLDFARGTTRAQRIADAVARVGGSWTFVMCAIGAIAVWMLVNQALGRAFDPYPYILLNLVLSCMAALQAPIIMMSQNRAAIRDRTQADQDFLVNLKAELEVAGLHAKVDHLLHERWEHLVQLQQLQLDVLGQIRKELARRQ